MKNNTLAHNLSHSYQTMVWPKVVKDTACHSALEISSDDNACSSAHIIYYYYIGYICFLVEFLGDKHSIVQQVVIV